MRHTDDDRDELQDSTEITLGTGKLLGLFLGLVVICAVFFSLGYALGKNTAGSVSTQLTQDPMAAPAGSAANSKPSPASDPSVEPAYVAPASNEPAAAPASSPAPATVEPVSDQPPAQNNATNPPSVKLVNASTAPAAAHAVIVQVAAVSKRDDAEILVKALQTKSYPAFLAASSSDNLFRVQVGPYGDVRQAEATKTRLAADGYTPILKR